MLNKFLLSTITILTVSSVNASDYYYEEKGIINNKATYQYSRTEHINDNTINLKPLSVYTGKTVTVTKHYDVYKPVVTYTKVGSYNTQTETDCNN